VNKTVDKHNLTLFGQKTGLILNSRSKSDAFLFFTFIKKKNETDWEKPSTGEGKSIKISLEELAMILRVLNKTAKAWKGFHSYEGTKTSIEVSWTGDDEVQIKVDQYSKQIKAGQLDVLKLLFNHLLKEKVEFSTEFKASSNGFNGPNGTRNGSKDTEGAEKMSTEPEKPIVAPKKNVPTQPPKKSSSPKKVSGSAKEPDITEVSGVIEKTAEKAIQVRFESGEEKWFPKSKIHSDYDENSQEPQMFQVESWLLKKKDSKTNNNE
jgi:hypothetical protein